MNELIREFERALELGDVVHQIIAYLFALHTYKQIYNKNSVNVCQISLRNRSILNSLISHLPVTHWPFPALLSYYKCKAMHAVLNMHNLYFPNSKKNEHLCHRVSLKLFFFLMRRRQQHFSARSFMTNVHIVTSHIVQRQLAKTLPSNIAL